MLYYVTTPFHNTVAKIWAEKPEEPHSVFESLPPGDGPIHLIEGVLVRYNTSPPDPDPQPMPDPIGDLQKEVKELEDVVDILMEGLV